LLTHWLCYISDRQTRFERVWEVGGYVISHMVRAFSRECGGSVRDLFDSYCLEEGNKLGLKCDKTPNEAANARLARFGIEETQGEVKFASRCPADDLVKVYRTLEILAKHYDRSLARFIAASFEGEDDDRQAIRRMATALNQLTYAVRQVSIAKFDAALAEMESDADKFAMPTDTEAEMFNRKRLWCCVRDYLKSPDFNEVLVCALKERRVGNPDRWDRTKNLELRLALDAIELPGDVWNSKVFRNGLFAPYLSEEITLLGTSRTIREVYELLGKGRSLRFYPEQLDVTFDFVPRMCERNMCDVCLFGRGIDKLCHRDRHRLCPVALVSCGYRHNCDPDACSIKENGSKEHCKETQRQGPHPLPLSQRERGDRDRENTIDA
jgi:hypothetical protein